MLQSNKTFYLRGTISASLTTWGTFTITGDLELWLPVETNWEIVSLVFRNRTQIERFTVTISDSICTIVKRGIEQTWGTTDVWLQRQWTEGSVGYLTALDFDLLDKDGESDTISSNITFEWENISNGSLDIQGEFKLPTFTDTTARDLVYVIPVEWDKCIITWVGEQYFEWGQWNTLWVSTPTPNASTTVAGRVQLSTEAQREAGDTTGSTGAILVPTNDSLVKTPTGAGDENKIALLNSNGKLDDFVSGVEMYTEQTAINTGDEIAFSRGGVNSRVDIDILSEHIIETEDIFLGTTARGSSDVTGIETIPHGLGRIPKLVELSYCERTSNSSINASYTWYADGTNNYCIWVTPTSWIDRIDDKCLMYASSGNGWSATITLTDTNIVIDWTKGGSGRNIGVIIKAK